MKRMGPPSLHRVLRTHCAQIIKETMKKILISMAVTIAVLLIATLLVMRLGLVAVNADQPPPSLEARLMPLALHASVTRHAPPQVNPTQPTEENLKAGIDTYRQMCARCHSLPDGEPSIYGSAFYPPAPLLSGGLPQYTDAELFWTVKHGIRNTGMLAWGGMLSDEEVWQVVTVLKHSGDLPPAVEAEWNRRSK
jgi:mono/diheme cytochrome c family protein